MDQDLILFSGTIPGKMNRWGTPTLRPPDPLIWGGSTPPAAQGVQLIAPALVSNMINWIPCLLSMWRVTRMAARWVWSSCHLEQDCQYIQRPDQIQWVELNAWPTLRALSNLLIKSYFSKKYTHNFLLFDSSVKFDKILGPFGRYMDYLYLRKIWPKIEFLAVKL